MSFAVVIFRDGNDVSEVPDNWLIDKRNEVYCWWPPAHMKNITSLIANRVKPNESTWSLLNVTVKKFCNTIEKARKIAGDSQLGDTDETELKKEYRKYKPGKRYLKEAPSSEEESDEEITTKSKRAKLPCVLPFPVQHYNNSINQNITTKSIISSHSIHDLEAANKEYKSTNSTTLQYNENSSEIEILNILKRIEEKLDNLTRCAIFQSDFNDIQQRVECITPIVKVYGSTENIRKLLPLTSVEEINNFERVLKEENNIIEYKTFIAKIGGHSARNNIKRVLSSIFDDRLARQCSLKGRKNNYGIEKLTIINIIRDTILDTYSTLTDIEFYDTCAEWFRFANQRYQRKEKNNTRYEILGP